MNLEKLVEDLTVKMLKTILQNVLDNITIFKKDLVNIAFRFTFISVIIYSLNSRIYFCHNFFDVSNFYNNMFVHGGFHKCITSL